MRLANITQKTGKGAFWQVENPQGGGYFQLEPGISRDFELSPENHSQGRATSSGWSGVKGGVWDGV